MNKFNEQIQIEETNLYKEGELMNEVNNGIQVGDKVKWLHSFQSLNMDCVGHVVSVNEKVMGNPCFLIRMCESLLTTKVSKDKVSKV